MGDGTGGAPAGDGSTMTPPAEGDAAMTPATSLTLAKGKILIGGPTVNINLSADNVGKPVSLAPSIYYGVSDKLTVGLIHDGGSTMWTPRPAIRSVTVVTPLGAITGSAGAGICLTGEDSGCPKVYDNVGVDALFSVKAEKFSLAAHPGLDIISFDPFSLGLRIGALGRYMANDKISIAFDPRVKIGLNERDAGNKETLDVPVWVWYMASDKLGVYVHTGINGPLDGFGDGFAIPVGLGATFKANEKLGVGGDFIFPNLAGKNSSADGRQLGIRVQYAL